MLSLLLLFVSRVASVGMPTLPDESNPYLQSSPSSLWGAYRGPVLQQFTPNHDPM